WLKETEGIRVEDGIKFSGGVSSFIFSVKLFYDTIEDNAGVIETAYKEGDIKLYTVKVHALKSSARIIGADELSKLAESLEDAGNRGDRAYIDDNTQKLLTDYRAYRSILSRLEEAGDEDEGKEEIPAEELQDAYTALKEVIPMMDYDSVEMILDQLKEYRLPKEDGEKMAELGRMLKVLDWDGMEQLIS
ncbi:MAG: Hpt domain-containing protein, partial [Lachnospiraceae bacterium]|nr:Hpt domain-containing protein [Lachnospiraceae bacterium]